MTYRLGISTCPNDTFMFHGLLEQRVDARGWQFEIELLDIQELNSSLAEGRFDFSKASTVAAFVHEDRYSYLSSGAAMGFGVGPLLLARPDAPPLTSSSARVLLPGSLTTAALLFRRFFGRGRQGGVATGSPQVSYAVFSEIMPALHEGTADYGVVIHEGRFTYKEQGLQLVADLGALWEEAYRAPLPLGCIVAKSTTSQEERALFTEILRDSIRYSYAHREEALLSMRRYAQELSDPVLWAHVDLYVNEWSVEAGDVGTKALTQFRNLVAEMG